MISRTLPVFSFGDTAIGVELLLVVVLSVGTLMGLLNVKLLSGCTCWAVAGTRTAIGVENVKVCCDGPLLLVDAERVDAVGIERLVVADVVATGFGRVGDANCSKGALVVVVGCGLAVAAVVHTDGAAAATAGRANETPRLMFALSVCSWILGK